MCVSVCVCRVCNVLAAHFSGGIGSEVVSVVRTSLCRAAVCPAAFSRSAAAAAGEGKHKHCKVRESVCEGERQREAERERERGGERVEAERGGERVEAERGGESH